MTTNPLDFSQADDVSIGEYSLIPKGTIAYAEVNMREVKKSKSGNDMLDFEFTLLGEHKNKRLWDNFVIQGKNAKGVDNIKFAQSRIKAILSINNYKKSDKEKFLLQDWSNLTGMVCAVKIGIRKNDHKQQDENYIATFISAVPEGNTFKDYQKLVEQDGEPPVRTESLDDIAFDDSSIPF